MGSFPCDIRAWPRWSRLSQSVLPQQKGTQMKKLQRRPVRFKGLSLGLDLHKKVMQYSVIDEAGDELINTRASAKRSVLWDLVDRLTRDGQALQVSLEASGTFLWAFDLLVAKLGREHVHVAAPSRVKVIAQSQEKTDANDAYWLAYFLWEGTLAEAFVAEGDLRELRIAVRELRAWTDHRSDLMRRMRSHLAQVGVDFPKSAWSSVQGRAKIEALVAEREAVGDERGVAVARLWRQIQQLDAEVEQWRDRMKQLSSRFAEVALIERELPGIGQQVSAVVWAEMGDPRRYRSAKAYGKATGLAPGYRESAGRRSKKGMMRCGSAHVRWALTRAVVSCLRCTKDPSGLAVKHWVQNLMRRKSKKAAIVAAARKLAEAIWRLFAYGEAFDLRKIFGSPPLTALAEARRAAGVAPA